MRPIAAAFAPSWFHRQPRSSGSRFLTDTTSGGDEMSDLRSTNAPIGADIQSDNSERLPPPPGPADGAGAQNPPHDMRGLTTHSEVDPGGKAKWVGAAVVAVALACGVAYAYEHGAFTPKQNTV